MKRHSDDIHVISPEWAYIIILAVLLFFCITAGHFVGFFTGARRGNLLMVCVFSFFGLISKWKGLKLSERYVKVVYCSVFYRCIRWSDIERIELMKTSQTAQVLIELIGCPAYPKGMLRFALYKFRHPIKLVCISLNEEKVEEQLKIIERFHPICTRQTY